MKFYQHGEHYHENAESPLLSVIFSTSLFLAATGASAKTVEITDPDFCLGSQSV